MSRLLRLPIAAAILCVAAVAWATPAAAQTAWFGNNSNIAAATGSFSATGQSASFTPMNARGFNISGWGTFVGSVQLERSFDGGATWLPITAAGTQLYVWSAPFSESDEEDQYNVLYRLNCTAYTSGTLSYRISQ